MRVSQKWLVFLGVALPQLIVSALCYGSGRVSGFLALCIGALAGFALCDVWYFLRMGRMALAFGPRRHLFALSKIRGRVGLMDIDRNGHCNNARFLRECGFGRRDLWQV